MEELQFRIFMGLKMAMISAINHNAQDFKNAMDKCDKLIKEYNEQCAAVKTEAQPDATNTQAIDKIKRREEKMRHINLQMDGNQICATWDNFDCLAVSPAGFGDNISGAVNDLIRNTPACELNGIMSAVENNTPYISYKDKI